MTKRAEDSAQEVASPTTAIEMVKSSRPPASTTMKRRKEQNQPWTWEHTGLQLKFLFVGFSAYVLATAGIACALRFLFSDLGRLNDVSRAVQTAATASEGAQPVAPADPATSGAFIFGGGEENVDAASTIIPKTYSYTAYTSQVANFLSGGWSGYNTNVDGAGAPRPAPGADLVVRNEVSGELIPYEDLNTTGHILMQIFAIPAALFFVVLFTLPFFLIAAARSDLYIREEDFRFFHESHIWNCQD